MSRASLAATLLSFVFLTTANAQVRGNAEYPTAQAKGNAERGNPRSWDYQTPNGSDITIQPYSMISDSEFIVRSNVQINVRADEFVAVFAVHQADSTVDAVQRGMAERIDGFMRGIKKAGVSDRDVYIDFITQVPVYDYVTSGRIAADRPVGYELKKTIAIHMLDSKKLDTLAMIAGQHGIYDLVKVDYIVHNIQKVQDRLRDSALAIVTRRRDKYRDLTELKSPLSTRLLTEQYSARYPQSSYAQYTAFEAPHLRITSNNPIVAEQRKVTTWYYSGMDVRPFDLVIDPLIIEPVVQFSLQLAIKYTAKDTSPRAQEKKKGA